MNKYIVNTNSGYIVAPSGYYRTADGAIVRDRSLDPRRSGPEHASSSRPSPYVFESLKYAQQQAAKCSGARIIPLA